MALRLLILEDDLAFLRMLEIRLKSWRDDLQITHVSLVADARKILDSEDPFDVVIFDQHLPDGIGASLFDHPKLEFTATLAVSSDSAGELPANAVVAGAQHFLGKRQITEPLFLPLLSALLERKTLESKLQNLRAKEAQVLTVRTLIATLQHEINNPLGAVFGGTYLLENIGTLTGEQQKALRVVKDSSERIKHVIQQLCDTVVLEMLEKGQEEVFHIPGDDPWEKN